MSSFLHTLLRDRLVWFVLAGLALFMTDWLVARHNDRAIIIDLPLVEKLAAQWQGQTKSPPSARQLDALIEGYIREEILVREATRLGLAGDDVIIRRRLAQKVEFFLSDNAVLPTPDAPTLKRYFETHKAHYQSPATLSFRHIFTADESDGRSARDAVRGGAPWRAQGAPFMLQREYGDVAQSNLAKLFGGDFAEALFGAAQDENKDEWLKPLRSAYGWHVVQVVNYTPKRAAVFGEIAPRLAQDWQNNEVEKRTRAAWVDLRAQYNIRLLPIADAP